MIKCQNLAKEAIVSYKKVKKDLDLLPKEIPPPARRMTIAQAIKEGILIGDESWEDFMTKMQDICIED